MTDDTEYYAIDDATITTTSDTERKAIERAYQAAGIDFVCRRVWAFTVDPDNDLVTEFLGELDDRINEGSATADLGDLTALAGETEGMQGLKSATDKLAEEPDVFGDSPDEEWEPDEQPESDAVTDGKETEADGGAVGKEPTGEPVSRTVEPSRATIRHGPAYLKGTESEPARRVCDMIEESDRRWVTASDIDVEGLGGYAGESNVMRDLWRGDVLDRRETDRTDVQAKYEYRITPGHARED